MILKRIYIKHFHKKAVYNQYIFFFGKEYIIVSIECIAIDSFMDPILNYWNVLFRYMFTFLYRLFMAKYKILGSFTDLIKDIILCDIVLNKKYTLNHPITKYTLDDILIDILYMGCL